MIPVIQEVYGSVPSAEQVARVAVRLAAALIIGILIGFQRELAHKPAGLRTHLLVAIGTALVVSRR